ncbi:MAG: ribonuclease J [Candidatus Improbicoccus devescovinae]|nr:MAG: ribonuclease J [Candidatus Improbicoccus devescovinae]
MEKLNDVPSVPDSEDKLEKKSSITSGNDNNKKREFKNKIIDAKSPGRPVRRVAKTGFLDRNIIMNQPISSAGRCIVTSRKTGPELNNNLNNKRIVRKAVLPVPMNVAQISNKYLSKVPSIKIIFLGGLNQIGRNLTVFEYEEDIIIVDCGMAFPDNEMLGVDLVIPDFTYLEKNKQKIKALIVTHGHEDHIGAIPYLLKRLNVPIYSASLTIGLIGSKLKEHKLFNSAKLYTISVGNNITLGNFNIEFVNINHSIPDALALAIKTPAGIIIHTGDFKIDYTPAWGEPINLVRFAELGKQGVLALMSDSTNADRPGYTVTEKNINNSFDFLFKQAGMRRIIVATFASNIGRVQQIINCAVKSGRKVAFSGRSMINYVSISRELGYITVPDGVVISLDEINKYKYEELIIISTGSQGEPMSALFRMAYGEHKKIEIGYDDFIIISANPIPGNERMVNLIINEMMKLGCEVIHESMYEIHVSGHACQEELKLIQTLTKPKFLIPVHGECKHLKKHAQIGENLGIDKSNIYIGETGDIIELDKFKIKKIGIAPAETIMVDGIGVGDVGSIVLKDRKHLGQDGLIVMVATLNFKEHKIVAGPDIVSRGFVYVRESEVLMTEAKKAAYKSIFESFAQKTCEWSALKTKVRDDLYKFFHDKTKRNPVILPIIMTLKGG